MRSVIKLPTCQHACTIKFYKHSVSIHAYILIPYAYGIRLIYRLCHFVMPVRDDVPSAFILCMEQQKVNVKVWKAWVISYEYCLFSVGTECTPFSQSLVRMRSTLSLMTVTCSVWIAAFLSVKEQRLVFHISPPIGRFFICKLIWNDDAFVLTKTHNVDIILIIEYPCENK